ncbi:MAG: glutamate--tRNA ligase [Sediminispirochaetaceae bacterium]
MSVRVRYAPSPTGLQHIGGVRTALFNYFFARAEGGTFILRVEDTDQERYHEEALQDLYDTFTWLGIEWDEGPDKGGEYGPYVQSQRFELYKQYAEQLVESGHAYYCFCSSERLDALREEQKKSKKGQGYDRRCRDLTDEQREEFRSQGIKPVIRFKVPLEGTTVFSDILLGEMKKKNKDIPPDPVLLKSDGFPTYHLANVVDDHLMKITHIMRAQEWIPSGPLHVLLYQAFGWEVPRYCHLPMVMGKDGQKLSKRHGATSVIEFRRQGYLPEALINYISLLGWSYDDKREFFSKEEFEKLFTLEKLNKAPAVFDYKKLEWFNGQYIREKSDEDLIGYVLPYLIRDGLVSDPPTAEQNTVIRNMMPLMKERLHLLKDISELSRFLLQEIDSYNIEDVIPKKMDAAGTLKILRAGRPLIAAFEENGEEKTEELLRLKAEEMEVKLGAMLMPVRVAITGTRTSPPLFGSIRLLGTEKTLERIDRVISLLESEE